MQNLAGSARVSCDFCKFIQLRFNHLYTSVLELGSHLTSRRKKLCFNLLITMNGEATQLI